MKYYKGKVMCDTCDEEFDITTNEPEAKGWYVKKNLPSCKHHTGDDNSKPNKRKRGR